MTILRVDPGIVRFGIRVDTRQQWGAIFFGKRALVFWGTGEETQAEEDKAKIRREARQRCLDEVVSLICDMRIERGIGVDVTRAYYLAVQTANRKRSYAEWE
jgi:hypothetical protein